MTLKQSKPWSSWGSGVLKLGGGFDEFFIQFQLKHHGYEAFILPRIPAVGVYRAIAVESRIIRQPNQNRIIYV